MRTTVIFGSSIRSRRTVASATPWLLVAALSVPSISPIPDRQPPPRYELAVTLDPDAHRLSARGTITLAPELVSRPTLRLKLTESMPDLLVRVIEPSASRGPATLRRDLKPGSSPGSGSITWTVVPKVAFPAGKRIVLEFTYAGGETPGFIFYLGPEGSFAGGVNTAWYPQVIDSAGETAWATGALTFRAPPGYTVVASGTPANPDGGGRWLVEKPTYFAFAAARYTVIRRDGPVAMAVYSLRPRATTEQYLDGCARILDVLVREFGPHPYGSRYAIVEVPSDKMGGSSGASFENFVFTTSAGLDAPFNPVFYGHEMGHVWWGNLLKETGDRGRIMLSEGMAQYGALVALEALQGPAAAARLRRDGDPASPIEHSATTYFSLAAAGLDRPLSALPGDWNSRNLASSKGPLVMSLLKETIGPDRFRSILHRFAEEHAFGRITWAQFADAFATGTDGRSRAFFEQWFDRPGAPDWKLTWVQVGDTIRGAVEQPAPYFAATVDVAVVHRTGERTMRRLEIGAGSRTNFTWVSPPATDVILDPEHRIPRWTDRLRAEAPLLAPYWSALTRDSENQTAAAISELDTALMNLPAGDTIGARFMLEEAMARLLAGSKLDQARIHVERSLTSASRRPHRLGWVYYLLGYIASAQGDTAAVRRAVVDAEAADAVAGGWSGWAPAVRAFLPVASKP